MNKKWLALSTGFALFSMFFGSGNLVFPITVGQESGGHYLLAAMGIISTGVLVPFLGVIGMMLYHGDLSQFFSSFGKRGTFIFSFLALALMGPFGVLARCLTVAHGALLLIFPSISLPISSLILCCLIYGLTLRRQRILSLLGTFLTPFLLLSIGTIAFFGFRDTSFPSPTVDQGWGALKNGFFQGYQTMDLLAAFFFSQFIIKQLYHQFPENSVRASARTIFLQASLIGATILSSVYFILVLLGWMYSAHLTGTPAQEMLGLITLHALGKFATPFLCFAIIFACLTTAIVLTSLFADFLRTEVTQSKLGRPMALFITLLIGFSVSTLEFAGIAKFLGPLLEVIYPALIALTIVNIVSHMFDFKTSHWPFTLTVVAKFWV